MQTFWYLVLYFILSGIESEGMHTRINGEHGWYLPLADGSLKWMDMDTIERIKSYNDDITLSANTDNFDWDAAVFDFTNRAGLDNIDNTDPNPGFISTAMSSISDIFNPVRFWLYSELSPDNGERIHAKAIDIETSAFNPEHPTVFASHGFLQAKFSFNMNRDLRKAFFSKGKYNFIYIEWLRALTLDYIAASRAVPNVGKKVAKLFDFLVKNYNMSCENTHFIGHSLGAHVVGMAAKNIRSCKVPHIIALDPALPLFPYSDTNNRLNSTDAEYVESIQTDGGFYGHVQPVGAATFYCNGGKTQPGCLRVNVCNHERSVAYVAEAIEKNNFPSTKCDDYTSAINNSCGDKLSDVKMGDDRNRFTARGVYSVKTNSRSPFGMLKV